jgi:hypothetical protein
MTEREKELILNGSEPERPPAEVRPSRERYIKELDPPSRAVQ